MKSIKGKAVRVCATLGLVSCLAVAASVESAWAEKPSAPKSEVSLSGTFTGSLEGMVTIGEREVLITSKTTLFRAGKGQVGRRNFISGDSVFVTGHMESGVLVARMVVITDRSRKHQLDELTDDHTKPGPKDKTQ